MIPEQVGQELHDKDTRGTPLNSQERDQLEEWYRQQDRAEGQLLSHREGVEPDATLRQQVGLALEQLKTIAQEIQVLAVANDQLRQEAADLRKRLAQQVGPQTA
ncbi:conserved hypothetical protein [Verrucomicrobia bacterium]|nr:conserved hypothetical protein [Verrucomicrobiota bacterium]